MVALSFLVITPYKIFCGEFSATSESSRDELYMQDGSGLNEVFFKGGGSNPAATLHFMAASRIRRLDNPFFLRYTLSKFRFH